MGWHGAVVDHSTLVQCSAVMPLVLVVALLLLLLLPLVLLLLLLLLVAAGIATGGP